MIGLGINFTAWPEMLAWPHFILNGWLPYKDIAIAHNPLLIIVLTFFYKLFGVGITQLQIFTWALILVNYFLLFWITKKLYNKKTAIIALAFYIPIQLLFEGNGLWFDLALVPFTLLLFYFISKKKYILSGIIFALGFLTKQTFIYFIIPIVLLNIKNKKNLFSIIKKFMIGLFFVLLIFFLALLSFGILEDFFFWAIKFGIIYLPTASGQVVLPILRQLAVYLFPFTISIFSPALIPWIVSGLIGAYPRWGLFHFQPALPFLAISFSLALTNFKDFSFKTIKLKKLLIFVYILIVGIIFVRFLSRNLNGEVRFYEQDVKDVVTELSILNPNDSDIFILSYWDNIYALTDTMPVTKPWIPYLSWYLRVSNFEDSLFSDIKTEMPEQIVVGIKPDYNWEEMKVFLERFYNCVEMSEKVSICSKNK